MRIKTGVKLDGLHFMLWYAAAVADYTRQALGLGEATVTGGREPADSYGPARVRGTLHPGGFALDVRTNDLPGGSQGQQAYQWAQAISRYLGGGFDVVVEADHIHVEYVQPLRA